MLTDDEAEAIRKGLAEGYRGPVLLKWLEQLLEDRDERRQRERMREANLGPVGTAQLQARGPFTKEWH